MLPQTKPHPRRNSPRINLLISCTFHGAIILALVYFAAREGLLGKQLQTIAVEMVKEKQPEKPKEPEKPAEQPISEKPKIAEAPKAEAPKPAAQAPPPSPSTPVTAPPAVAPPAAEISSFVFEGGKEVISTSDPVQNYKGLVEYALLSRWNRPSDMADHQFVAEVEVSVNPAGTISNPVWKKSSGNTRWDNSVRQALANARAIDSPPPTNFPARVLVRFDVQEVLEAVDPQP